LLLQATPQVHHIGHGLRNYWTGCRLPVEPSENCGLRSGAHGRAGMSTRRRSEIAMRGDRVVDTHGHRSRMRNVTVRDSRVVLCSRRGRATPLTHIHGTGSSACAGARCGGPGGGPDGSTPSRPSRSTASVPQGLRTPAPRQSRRPDAALLVAPRTGERRLWRTAEADLRASTAGAGRGGTVCAARRGNGDRSRVRPPPRSRFPTTCSRRNWFIDSPKLQEKTLPLAPVNPAGQFCVMAHSDLRDVGLFIRVCRRVRSRPKYPQYKMYAHQLIG
jgi:hypothetical protein